MNFVKVTVLKPGPIKGDPPIELQMRINAHKIIFVSETTKGHGADVAIRDFVFPVKETIGEINKQLDSNSSWNGLPNVKSTGSVTERFHLKEKPNGDKI